jgi:hypothetical protein
MSRVFIVGRFWVSSRSFGRRHSLLRRQPFRLGWRCSNPLGPDFADHSTDTEFDSARVYGSSAHTFHSAFPVCGTDPDGPVHTVLLRKGAVSQ